MEIDSHSSQVYILEIHTSALIFLIMYTIHNCTELHLSLLTDRTQNLITEPITRAINTIINAIQLFGEKNISVGVWELTYSFKLCWVNPTIFTPMIFYLMHMFVFFYILLTDIYEFSIKTEISKHLFPLFPVTLFSSFQ